jgi:protein TonB
MFEQSMLLEDAAGKRARALAVSLTMQAGIVGALVLLPLVYSDRLPNIQPWISIAAPVPHPLPEPEPQKAAAHVSSRASILTRRPFPFPISDPQPLDLHPTTIPADDLPFDPGLAGASFGLPIGSGELLPRIIAEPPKVLKPAPIVKPAEVPHAVGGDVQAAKLTRKILPVYPPLARQARVSGTVHLVGVIAKDGTIQQLQVVSGNPLLVQAALAAVRQWVYRPTLLNGEAVEVIAPIDVIFTLSQ